MSDGVSSTTSTDRTRPPPPPPPPPPKPEPAKEAQQWGGADRFEQPASAAKPDPAAAQPAQAGADKGQEKPGFWGNVGGFFKGAWDGGVDTVKGVGNMAKGAWNLTGGWATNPEASKQTVQSIKDTASTVWNHPGAVVDAVTKPITEPWSKGNYGEAIGRGAFEAASVVLGAKGLDKVAKLGKVGEVANTASKLEKTAEVANAAAKLEKTAEVANAAAKTEKAAEVANAAAKTEEVANAAAKAAKAENVIAGTFTKEAAIAEAKKFPPGAARAEATASFRGKWQQGNLNKAIEKLGPNVDIKPTTSGKVLYTSQDGTKQVVHDVHGNYFRNMDPTKGGNRPYLDQNFNALPKGSPDYNLNTHFRMD